MKKQETKNLNVFRLFFQTIPVLVAICIIISFKGYNLYFHNLNLSLGALGSFVVAILTCVVTQLFVNVNPILRSTKTGIIVGTLLTIESVLFLLFAQYHILISFWLLFFMLVFSFWLSEKILKFNAEKRQLTSNLKKWCNSRSNSLVAYALCLVLLVPAGVGVYEEYYRYSLSSEKWGDFVEWFNNSTATEVEKTETTMPYEDKIVGLLKWESLNLEEKERTIRAVALIEKEALGISENVEIIVSTEKMPDSTCGYYSESTFYKEIFINFKYLNEGELEDILVTVLHEMHHAFVYHTVDSIDFDSEIVKKNFYYNQAREWKANMENYISADYNYEGYRSQPIEADARAYAEERANVYLNYIKENSDK